VAGGASWRRFENEVKRKRPMTRGDELKPLSWDHHHGLVLAFRLKRGMNKGADKQVMTDYILHAWHNTLHRHFSKEEEFLVEPLKKYSRNGKELIGKLKIEHTFFKELLGKIEQRDKNLFSSIQDFAEALEKHIRFEERDLFPAVEKSIPPKLLQKIGHSLHELHQTGDMCWTPEFWT
jgi:hemerythrin-like domain-containing protein